MKNRLIHIATIFVPKKGKKTLYLRQFPATLFKWLLEDRVETEIESTTIESALQEAQRYWKSFYFRTLICGFRYNLPERDEHGMNALFYQLAASRSSINGVYFDEELGHNCYVQNPSDEALFFLKQLSKEDKL